MKGKLKRGLQHPLSSPLKTLALHATMFPQAEIQMVPLGQQDGWVCQARLLLWKMGLAEPVPVCLFAVNERSFYSLFSWYFRNDQDTLFHP